MNILISSHAFAPSIGGIETVTRILADEFVRMGHKATVLTQSRGLSEHEIFEVVRCPSVLRTAELVRWADVVWHNNISLRSAWPLLVHHRPWVVTHQTWLRSIDGQSSWREKAKLFALVSARSVSVSHALANSLQIRSTVIGNPYDARVFRLMPEQSRSRDLVFVGRLVSDKGVDLLLRSLIDLRREGLCPSLTVIGAGPESGNLVRLVNEAGMHEQVTFTGAKRGHELAAILNDHRILVAPSRWREPFGIVALEGIACGCAVVASEQGGLREAVGPCGLTFQNGSVAELTKRLRYILCDKALEQRCRAARDVHLGRFSPENIALQYLALFAEVAR